MLLIETVLIVSSLIIALIYPSLGATWFVALERGFVRVARRRVLSVLVVGFLALGLRIAFLPIEPIPQPVVHDEFGYLLAADTFAHGRLTNPTHPLWKHFESFNIIQRPTYQSYPQPAQGLLLAGSKTVTGSPFWGVCLSAGLMCAAICWMLQAWLPARWALLGGLIAVFRFAVFGYWANSYWGGALGATGGALILGSLPRIKRTPRVRDAVVLALGLVLLANTRPYEGFVFSVPVVIALFVWMFGKNRPTFAILLRRVIAPAGLVLIVAAAGMGYYFWRVTGSPFRMPYSVERQTYAIAPYFLWQPLRPRPVYYDSVVEQMYTGDQSGDEMAGYTFFRSPVGMFAKLFWSWRFYLGPVLTFPIVMLLFALPYGFSWRDIKVRTRFLFMLLLVSVVALEIECFYAPHYPAPVTCVLLALVLLALRGLKNWCCWGKPTGLFLTRAVPSICLLMFVLRASAGPLHIHLDSYYAPAWYQLGPPDFGRAHIQRQLDTLPGKHLVIVRYAPDHKVFNEWVYNAADIDNSRIVWARELDPKDNEELIQYFSGRQVWLLEADENPPRLEQYAFPRSASESVASTDPHLDRVEK
jgi:hypothetical protein